MCCPVAQSLRLTLKPRRGSPVVAAFSGGVDSTVLLHALVALKNAGAIGSLRAVHVNHGLSKNALKWEMHCRSLCENWSVPLAVANVCISDTSGTGLEQAARSARYQVFRDELNAGECLLQGHHLNDQAETLLFRLFRGTGVDGLGGIPHSRPLGEGMLIRPLLSVSRDDIEAYASRYQLAHINDESNEDQHFSRNYLRHSLLPVVEDRWPGASVRLAAVADELSLANEQFAGTIAELTRLAVQTRPEWLLGSQPLLDVEKLSSFRQHVRQQVVRCWLKQQQLPVPSREILKKIFTEVINARVDAAPLLCWPGCELRRYKGLMIASSPQLEKKPVVDMYWDWANQPQFFHPSLGCLRIKESAAGIHSGKCLALPDCFLEIRTRESIDPAMKISIAGRAGRKTLKRWLQEFNIPPWLRASIPFLFVNERLVAAPGLWVCCDDFADAKGRYQVEWDHLHSCEND